MRPTRLRHARLYETLRTAHLERARALPPATILYRHRRYDFEAAQADGLDVRRAGRLAATVALLRSELDTLEVNEPLMVRGLPSAALAVAAVRLGDAVRRRHTTVVTYAIANHEKRLYEDRTPLYRRTRRSLDRWLSSVVARRVDRIVYGTAASEEYYRDRLGKSLSKVAATLIPALPSPCPCASGSDRAPGGVIFLGALDSRKGVTSLIQAWPHVLAAAPSARLTIVGKGTHEVEVRAFAAEHESVEVVVDPPRKTIHRLLNDASVLVLLSQRTPQWREQVGLPIVEGLAHGCSIVTTRETGLAEWLTGHGHRVLDPLDSTATVSAAIVDALEARRSPAAVLRDLPAQDGRLIGDAWLLRT